MPTTDQSMALAQLLKSRFTDPETGRGGRLEFRRLEGSHITPNTPALYTAWLQIDDASRALGPVLAR